MRYLLFPLLPLFLVACGTPPKPVQPIQIPDTTQRASGPREQHPPMEVIGQWRSRNLEGGREVTLNVREDSLLTFAGRTTVQGKTKYYIAVGDWIIRQDTILEMKEITDGRRFKSKDLFPELYASGDSANLVSMPITVTFIVGKTYLHSITKEGKRDTVQVYDRLAK